MGLAEQINAGAFFERTSKAFQSDISGFGSVSIAPSYVLLSVQTDKPIRLRLYDNNASLIDSGEIARQFGNTAVSNSIALIADISMSAGLYTIDPALYAVSEDMMNPSTYYRVENNSNASIVLNYYPIESNIVQPIPGTAYSIPNRRTLHISRSLAAGGILQGAVPFTVPFDTPGTDPIIPNTYLLVSASLNDVNQVARLRLYTDQASLVTDDNFRPFSVEPTGSGILPDIGLIADIILSGSETIYFSPKIIGSNLQTVRINQSSVINRDLFTMKDTIQLLSGYKRLYYKLSNLGPTLESITASLHVYSLEE